MPPARIIFLTPHDPYDPEKWSGTIHSVFRALENNADGIKITPIESKWITLAGRVLNKVLLERLKIDCRFSTLFAIATGISLTIRLFFFGDGPIVAIAASNYVPYLNTRRPIIYISDATFRSIAELNPNFKAFPRWLRKQGDANEGISLRKSRYLIYPSKWASNSARHDYGVADEKIYQLPFGPNIPDELIRPKDRSALSIASEVRIVFISTDWKLKDGDKVISVCRTLIAAGIKVRLITIGTTPNQIKRIDFVEDKGFLHKSDPAQMQALCEIYREAHFLILPTTADAFGIVLCEAQAFGVPPVTNEVGGTGSVVEHARTGLLLPKEATAEMFAKEMIPYIKNPEAYQELSRRCRAWHVETANWANWSKLIIRLAKNSSDFLRAQLDRA